jgi:hypothetical protein
MKIQSVPTVKINFGDLIPEQMLTQKRHTHMGPIPNGLGVMSFLSTVNKLERKGGALCIY